MNWDTIYFMLIWEALKLSYSSSPNGPPSRVYAYSQLKSSTSKWSAPLPISSSGPNAILISPCSICGFFNKHTIASIIATRPDLSSEPNKKVLPSVTINVFPI